MNRFKNFMAASSTLSVVACFFVALVCAGCGDSGTFAGTSEETNEFAEYVSSSSVDELSSSVQVSSSSAQTLSSSHADRGEEFSLSSSSKIVNAAPTECSSSSDERDSLVPSSNGDTINRTLDDYLNLFKLNSASFDGGVLSATFDRMDDNGDNNPPTASATEFDGPWPHKFVKQNIGALREFFPLAEKEYSEIVTAIKNGTLDANCGLYMLNVQGSNDAAGFVLANIVKDSITVLDIPVGSCKSTWGNVVRFLFYYCGELDSRPEIVHVPNEESLSAKCPAVKNEGEWVKDKSKTP